MEPTRERDHAIVDLLDVLLTEGVILQADVVVTVADIPLIGINLRAAIAGMETMTEYGVFADWDGEIRAREDSGRTVERIESTQPESDSDSPSEPSEPET
jgi:hypothetical protein